MKLKKKPPLERRSKANSLLNLPYQLQERQDFTKPQELVKPIDTTYRFRRLSIGSQKSSEPRYGTLHKNANVRYSSAPAIALPSKEVMHAHVFFASPQSSAFNSPRVLSPAPPSLTSSMSTLSSDATIDTPVGQPWQSTDSEWSAETTLSDQPRLRRKMKPKGESLRQIRQRQSNAELMKEMQSGVHMYLEGRLPCPRSQTI